MKNVIKGERYIPTEPSTLELVAIGDGENNNTFEAVVVVSNEYWDVGEIMTNWDKNKFKLKTTRETEKNLKPKQYRIGIDSFERAKANMSKEKIIGACKLNIDKYTWREKGTDKEDVEKLKDYADLWLWALENK